ncbi:MAG: hypothetical protein KDI82_15525 [Gammaproteobacteria bacterium]|nr:hypothetical protein [Gammaproteobacteria bacterium]
MQQAFLVLASMSFFTALAQAHVSQASDVQHAAEHAWLALLLLPAGVLGLRLLRNRRR